MIARLLILILFSAAAAVAFQTNSFPLCVILALCALVTAWSIFGKYRAMKTKIRMVLEAVDNDDFTFRYSTGENAHADSDVNAYLNELVKLLEKKNDEERRRDRYFEVIINSVNTGILVVNEFGSVLQSNNAARRMLSLPVIANIWQLANVDSRLVETFSSEEASRTLSFMAQDNRMVSLSVKCVEMKLNDRDVRIYTITDIRSDLDAKEMESWERIARILSHEIMNSLTPVISICDSLLSDRGAGHEEILQGLTAVSATGKDLISFVENYRRFTNVPHPEPSLFYVRPFLERMRDVALHQYPDADITVNLNIADNDMILYADERLSAHVVSNIMKNAAEAIISDGSRSGTINVDASVTADEAVRIDISNSGPLIPDDEKERIFVPFYTTRSTGSGIGLALARRIMNVSGGSLSLTTRPQTKFSLLFP